MKEERERETRDDHCIQKNKHILAHEHEFGGGVGELSIQREIQRANGRVRTRKRLWMAFFWILDERGEKIYTDLAKRRRKRAQTQKKNDTTGAWPGAWGGRGVGTGTR